MADLARGRSQVLLVLLGFLGQVHSQGPCRIDIDSTRGLWRDVTPASWPSPCPSYSYRETPLTCTRTPCPSTLDGDCTVYVNADTHWPCLATCARGCPHGVSCPVQGPCPCTRGEARYSATQMCVPHLQVRSSPSGYVFSKGVFSPPSCLDTCPNGRCDSEGKCSCNRGFRVDPKTEMCVPNACLDTCQHGTCHVYGECACHNDYRKTEGGNGCVWKGQYGGCLLSECHTIGWCEQRNANCQCYDGFKNDPNNKDKCNPILCPDIQADEFCQRACVNSTCGKQNGWCDRGECKCKAGEKKYPFQSECEPIRCPDAMEATKCMTYCKSRCVNGSCNDDGDCRCNDGYRKDARDEFLCTAISCPSSGPEAFCQTQCLDRCKNGSCNDDGDCRCNDGYRKDARDEYLCTAISCPSSGPEAFCQTQCLDRCKNGACSERGACECHDGFVSTDVAVNASCHDACHRDGSCDSNVWIGVAGGVAAVGVVGIGVVGVGVLVEVLARKRKERARKEREEAQGVAVVDFPIVVDSADRGALPPHPEYANLDEDFEVENTLYQRVEFRPAPKDVQQ